MKWRETYCSNRSWAFPPLAGVHTCEPSESLLLASAGGALRPLPVPLPPHRAAASAAPACGPWLCAAPLQPPARRKPPVGEVKACRGHGRL